MPLNHYYLVIPFLMFSFLHSLFFALQVCLLVPVIFPLSLYTALCYSEDSFYMVEFWVCLHHQVASCLVWITLSLYALYLYVLVIFRCETYFSQTVDHIRLFCSKIMYCIAFKLFPEFDCQFDISILCRNQSKLFQRKWICFALNIWILGTVHRFFSSSLFVYLLQIFYQPSIRFSISCLLYSAMVTISELHVPFSVHVKGMDL